MPTDRASAYQELTTGLSAVLADCRDEVAVLASAAAVLADLPGVSWVGFYRVVEPRLLRVGPYQGPLGCLEIEFGKGVCGAAAESGRTVLVDDVHSFAGHIACDPTARSEIVVPVFGASGELRAVLDLDSREPASFGDVDRQNLEAIAATIGRRLP